ncbi:hypothetical protein [Fulvivirga kasyanovii]|uniref:YD repeat-containing protein n=1 Tax=Fulvivirga kasyanovii TaxID=396812 RepID=A0ABW9RXU1_9BACT|nr:hypothetical protein [Fulvivirga kasyanovii]MTI28084.1 hypothetical protein [Fulvivirga kasyanovii]
MKDLLLITFISLLFACQSQPFDHPASTLDDFNTEQIFSNNLKSIKQYSRVPSTNPDSLIEPIGLMLRQEFSFNRAGKLIDTRCISCGVQFHAEPHHVDLIKQIEYENGLINGYTEFGFDTTLFEVKYFDRVSLTRGFKDQEQGFTSIEHYDSIGRLTEQLKFEFFSSYAYEQSVQQVFFRKVAYEYDPETTYKQSFKQTGQVNMVTLTPEQFALLKTDNIEKIEELTNLYELESIGTEVIKYSKSGNVILRRMHNTTYPDETLYEYDEEGLLKMKNNKYNGHEFVSEYRYEKW